MAKYRQKPVVIDAFQFTGDIQAAFDWVGQWHDEDDGPGMREDELAGKPALVVDNGDSEMWLIEGEWLVRDVDGEFHMYKNDAFEKLYELVKPEEKES